MKSKSFFAPSLPTSFSSRDEAATCISKLDAWPICSPAESCSYNFSLSDSPSRPTSFCSPDGAASCVPCACRSVSRHSSAESCSYDFSLSNSPLFRHSFGLLMGLPRVYRNWALGQFARQSRVAHIILVCRHLLRDSLPLLMRLPGA
jgi:hypothetical protein